MDRWGSIALMLLAVAAAIRPPRRVPQWGVPVLCSLVALIGGITTGSSSGSALHPLVQPVAFLLAAVPLAVMLDELGFFKAVASRITARGGGPGSLWALAAVVTTVLNLDAGVVLLTPLYIRIARQRGWDPLVLAAQPVLLACLASSALPVSNLTNLIAVSWAGATTTQFVSHLALPSLAACVIGWYFYRAFFVGRLVASTEGPPSSTVPASARATATPAAGSLDDDRRALRVGTPIVVCVLIGFVAGPFAGISPWAVALMADAVLLALAWRRSVASPSVQASNPDSCGDPVNSAGSLRRAAPWGSVPVGTAVMVFALGILATAVAAHLPTGALFRGGSVADLARDTGVAAIGANVVNNLPALLVALPKIGHHPVPALWAVLLGVNMGPVVLVTGSLASLLWMSALRRLNVGVSPRDFTRFGVVAGLPAAAGALGVSLCLRALGLY